jgi:hypothetical protein
MSIARRDTTCALVQNLYLIQPDVMTVERLALPVLRQSTAFANLYSLSHLERYRDTH